MSEIITTEEVTAAATAFLTAFDQLDWEPFSSFIAPDATVFMPFANVQRRLEGKAAIEAVFADFFARVRQERSGPSYLDIRPVDLDIHLLGDSALVKLENGGYLADTPGIRQMQVWDVEPDELDGYFVDLADYVEHCKFSNCTHTNEPGCAVLEAIEKGEISRTRYENYLHLRDDLKDTYIVY